ncbi:MAG TPA: hypothetical protein VKR99_05455, partial [Candidatus Eremiobacteraceae bacterium]|nr:hypothetical protein [Candidatus Eremiobacteraceae bacterium]
MPRIDPAPGEVPAAVQAVLDRQEKRYGSALYNHLVLARCPTIFAGFRAMWDGIDESALLPASLLSLLNL